jgi:hypothetical protein
MYTSISYDLPRQNLPSDTVDLLAWLSRPSKHDPRTVPRVEVDPVNFHLFHYRFLFTLLIPSQRSADLVESRLGQTRALSNQTIPSRTSINPSGHQSQ